MYALPLVILTCFAIAYSPAFQKLVKQWSAGDNSYCYLIVPLFLYLLWDMRGAQRSGIGVRGEVVRAEGRRTKEEGRGKMNEGPMRSGVPHPSEAVLLPPSVQKTEGFRFGEFSWSLWGLVPVFFQFF